MNTRLYFYEREQLKVEIDGPLSWKWLRSADQPLAEQHGNSSAAQTHLLAADRQKSLLQIRGGGDQAVRAYTPYGHDICPPSAASRLGFNGEHRELSTGVYLLGQGYRAYSPVLMRFRSPDSLSPFDEGGINSYGYCVCDPVNYSDPTGHAPTPAQLTSMLGKLKKPGQTGSSHPQRSASAPNAPHTSMPPPKKTEAKRSQPKKQLTFNETTEEIPRIEERVLFKRARYQERKTLINDIHQSQTKADALQTELDYLLAPSTELFHNRFNKNRDYMNRAVLVFMERAEIQDRLRSLHSTLKSIRL